MAFAQARVTVDTMAEYQVMTHDYGAEYGGASGVIVNAGHQERDESILWQWVLLQAGRQAERHQLLHQGSRREKAGERQRCPRGEHWRADPQEQVVLVFQLRA
jgi:hypothetical protein